VRLLSEKSSKERKYREKLKQAGEMHMERSHSMELAMGYATGIINNPYSAAGSIIRTTLHGSDGSPYSTSSSEYTKRKPEYDDATATQMRDKRPVAQTDVDEIQTERTPMTRASRSESEDAGEIVDTRTGDYVRYEGSLAQMESGQIGWAVPWEISYDANGHYYIDSDVDLEPAEGGTLQMDIIKLGNTFFVDRFDLENAENAKHFSEIYAKNPARLTPIYSTDDMSLLEEIEARAAEMTAPQREQVVTKLEELKPQFEAEASDEKETLFARMLAIFVGKGDE